MSRAIYYSRYSNKDSTVTRLSDAQVLPNTVLKRTQQGENAFVHNTLSEVMPVVWEVFTTPARRCIYSPFILSHEYILSAGALYVCVGGSDARGLERARYPQGLYRGAYP